jgi:DNA-binding NtrC family response regulator
VHKKKGILVLDGNAQSSQIICNILKSQHYPTNAIHSLSELKPCIEKDDPMAAIIDIDSVPVDDRSIRNLALKYPGVRFLGTSKDRFHPELKDAICYHLYACLNKPVDPDELLYWIKSIYEEQAPDT